MDIHSCHGTVTGTNNNNNTTRDGRRREWGKGLAVVHSGSSGCRGSRGMPVPHVPATIYHIDVSASGHPLATRRGGVRSFVCV